MIFLSKLFLILVLLSFCAKSLIIDLTPNHEVCLHKDLKASDTLKVTYIVTGEDESSCSSKLHGPYSTTLYHYEHQKSGYFETEIHNDGIIIT